MQFLRQLLELNNRYIQTKPIEMSNHSYRTSAKIGSRYIIFNAEQEDLDSKWDISFAETVHPPFRTLVGAKWDATGSGNEVEVFNFITQATRDFVDSHRPAIITFTAEKDDKRTFKKEVNRVLPEHGTRARLYKKAVQRVLPEYELEIDHHEGDEAVEFKLVRKSR